MIQIDEKRTKTGFAITIFIFGLIVPFNETLIVVEVFYLLIPLSILFLASLIYLVTALFLKDSKPAFFIACLIPLFIASQVISIFAVTKIQRARG